MPRLERIVSELGGLVYDAGRRALIPGPGHGAADRSVSLIETDEGRILVHCFSPADDWRAVRDALRARGLLDASVDPSEQAVVRPTPDVLHEDKRARAERFWNESRALRFTPALAYLQRRRIADPASAELRFHPRMTSIDDRMRRPALMAAIRDRDGALQGVQATLLTAYGAAKANVETPRRVIGKLVGGAVRLTPIADILIIAEGVESALSASQGIDAPAWAALTAYNLSQFDPPAEVRLLIAAPDNDAAGLNALAVLRERLSHRIEIEHAPPPAGLNDWNAWATAQRA